MQGVIVTPSRDVWVLGMTKNQLIYLPKGEPSKGRIVCQGSSAEPCRSMNAPFLLAIDQQDRIWVSNSAGDSVIRFPASDPSKVETFKVGYGPSGLAVDSRGNVWVPNQLGSSERGRTAYQLMQQAGTALMETPLIRHILYYWWREGSVTLLRPDGSEAPGSPLPAAAFRARLPSRWMETTISGSPTSPSHRAGSRSCAASGPRPARRHEDSYQISPPDGYLGGGLQMLTDIGIGPAEDVWVADKWQLIDSCYPIPLETSEALSTQCGGQGLTVFYGMAKPVRTPQIGPARAP
jgi:hypothetical protein